ncbi:MAG: hypothetical protein IT370_13155 [Deltaproteobacteria bacterium]|nr:hypothetical protein [Deltaproteobacteria bacterium]
MVASRDGHTLYVALPGLEDLPGDSVAVVDVGAGRVRRRIQVGRAPVALALHPGGEFLVVSNLYSSWASVIDTRCDCVVASVPVPYYTSALAFAPDGRQLYLANRWKDALLTWQLTVTSARFSVDATDYSGRDLDQPMGRALAPNPGELAVSDDGSLVAVGSATGVAIDLVPGAGASGAARRLRVGSPIGGLLLVGPWLVATHIGRGTGHPPADGVDGDEDGRPGDGTGNVMFQDVQNELEVFALASGQSVDLITSDTICCKDYRDVDPDHPTRGLAIAAPESWPPERVAALPPRERWLVGGALPTRMARVASPEPGFARFLVVMSASNQAQRFELELATGRLRAVDVPGALYDTGHAPSDVVASPDGRTAWVVERLGETVSGLDAVVGPATPRREIVVGDVSAGRFPATDVELGELFNAVTAPLTVDGDQSCVHCHRDGGNLDRVVAMPLQTDRTWGSRQIQAYRGAYDTRPWFLEAAMDQNNFFPVLNEFARKENFCCELADALVWSRYPGVAACVASPTLPGCDHVLSCEDDPPPECASRGYGATTATRDALMQAGVLRLAGRTTSFGDSLRLPSGGPIRLGFDGVTRAIGLFLLAAPRLPPNPNRALALPGAARGELLYQRAELGCAACHPLPLTTLASQPAFNPFLRPLRSPPVISPTRAPGGAVADTVTEGFRATFSVEGVPPVEQGPEGLHVGVPQLRGLWDRAPRFYHDGRARSLRQALLPPGHHALDGAPGFNERDGVPDSHGGTSQLDDTEVADLIEFLLTR